MKGVFTKKEAKKLDKKATEGTVKKASEEAGNIVMKKAEKKDSENPEGKARPFKRSVLRSPDPEIQANA